MDYFIVNAKTLNKIILDKILLKNKISINYTCSKKKNLDASFLLYEKLCFTLLIKRRACSYILLNEHKIILLQFKFI